MISPFTAPSGWGMVRMMSRETNMGTAQESTKQNRQKPLALVCLRLMTMVGLMPAKQFGEGGEEGSRQRPAQHGPEGAAQHTAAVEPGFVKFRQQKI